MTAVMLSVENGSSVSFWVGTLSVSWIICLNDQATKLEIHFYKRYYVVIGDVKHVKIININFLRYLHC